jgi:predicted amidohydrolase
VKPPVYVLMLALSLCAFRLNAADFSQPFRAGCAQIFITGDVRANTDKVISFIRQADSLGLDIVLFPETALSGYFPLHYPQGDYPSGALLDSALIAVRDAARESGIWVVVGTSTQSDGRYYNMVYTIDNRGEIHSSYGKVHGTGGKDYGRWLEIKAFEDEGMRYGLQICYDARFPEAWRILALQGAQVVFHVSHAAGGDAWKTPVWEAHLRSRAAENNYWVVSCNCAGPVQAGKSYIVDPNGLLVAESNQEREEMITGTIDLSQAKRGILWSRRTDMYRLTPGDTAAVK